MQTNSIYEKFKNLTQSNADASAFNVITVPNTKHKLGVSCEGYPKFFVSTNESATSSTNMTREILTVQYNLPCTIIENGDKQYSNNFSIITLQALEKQLQIYFIDIFVMMLEKLPPIPSKRVLSIEIENIITIFSALKSKPIKEIQGLWAELLVIEQSLHPETLIAAWHSQPNAKYDFTMGRDKIEVKSTSAEERIHRFALDQLNPSPNSRLLIASVIVRESAEGTGGLSLHNLYDRICNRVTVVNSRLKLYSTLVATIGSDYTKFDNVFFDHVAASDSLAFFDVKVVPHIKKSDVPEFVSDVKFSSNLSHLIDIRNSDSDFNYADSPLFKSLF